MESVVCKLITCMLDCCGSSGHLNTLDHAFAYLRSAPIRGSRIEVWGTWRPGFIFRCHKVSFDKSYVVSFTVNVVEATYDDT